MIRAAPILACLLALLLAACGEEDESAEPATTTSGAGDECEQVEEPPARNVKLKPPTGSVEGESMTALVRTSCGEFEIDLDTEDAPETAASFVHMVEEGVYEDTTFARIVPGFVIQGGDPRGDTTGDAGYTIEEAPPPDALYTRGVVAMAKTGAEPPGTSGSQFFVVTAADAGLPADYAVLGEVSSGEATLDAIDAQGNPAAEADPEAALEPKQPVVIEEITVE